MIAKSEKRKVKSYRIFGFTLIELLVVISIIGILVSLVAVSYTQAQKQARDSQRKSDLKQYQIAVENYAASNNLYPVGAGTFYASTSLCTLLAPNYLPSCPGPDDPRPVVYRYRYNSTADSASYVLWTQLEGRTTVTYWEVCSNGKSGESSAAPAGGVCNLP